MIPTSPADMWLILLINRSGRRTSILIIGAGYHGNAYVMVDMATMIGIIIYGEVKVGFR